MSPIVPLLAWTGAVGGMRRFELDLPAGETMPAWQLWGYPHAAIAMGLLALALAGAISLAEGARSRTRIAGVAFAAGMAAWLHPWQGAIFLAVIGALLLQARSRETLATFAAPVLAVLAPIAYLAILPHADAGWRVLSMQNTAGRVPIWMLLAALGPLVVAALWGARALSRGPLATVLVTWPLAAIAVYLVSHQFRYHALQGLSIPLAAMAVAGWRASPRAAWVGAFAVGAAVAAGVAYEATTLRDSVRAHVAPYMLTAGERQALTFLDSTPQPGGVLARYYLGMTVPAYTGRRTWVGENTWTPDFARRAQAAEALFGGAFSAAKTQRFVRLIGARFVLVDCGAHAQFDRALGSLVASAHRFGCARVYVLR
jgi:hypothetical protein